MEKDKISHNNCESSTQPEKIDRRDMIARTVRGFAGLIGAIVANKLVSNCSSQEIDPNMPVVQDLDECISQAMASVSDEPYRLMTIHQRAKEEKELRRQNGGHLPYQKPPLEGVYGDRMTRQTKERKAISACQKRIRQQQEARSRYTTQKTLEEADRARRKQIYGTE